MPLPSNCAACAFHQPNGKLCRRHSAGVSEKLNERAFWLATPDASRCAQGDAEGKVVPCGSCAHWYQPDGKPIPPPGSPGKDSLDSYWASTIGEKDEDWWKESGLCTASAPWPGGHKGRTAYPRVTHRTLDGCGDGSDVTEEEGEEDEGGC